MTQELIYTSVPKGLQLGSRGFCTVACTAGISKPLADRLEALSGYKHLYPPGGESSHLNPVNYSFVTFKLGGKIYYVLSRIADAGLDYTQRSNKLAHHVVLEGSELPPAGPAWLMRQPGFFVTSWDGEPRPIEPRRLPLSPDAGPRKCDVWQSVTGDAGWGGVLAGNDEVSGLMEANIVFAPPGENLLTLVEEAQSLLPPSKRWGATFSTYYSKLPPGVECHWRFLPHDSAEAVVARRSHSTLLVDLLSKTGVNNATDSVKAARTGVFPSPKPILKVPTPKQHSFELAVHVDSNNSAEVSHPLGLEATISPPRLPPAAALSARPGGFPLPQIKKPQPWKVIATVLGVLAVAISLLGAAFYIFDAPNSPLADSSNQSPAKASQTPNTLKDTPLEVAKADGPLDNSGAMAELNTAPSSAPDLPPPPQHNNGDEPNADKSSSAESTDSLPQASNPNGETTDAILPTVLFDSILESVVVPKVTWAAQSRDWQKPISLGTIPRPHPPLAISLHTEVKRQISIASNKSPWQVTGRNGKAIAEISESDTSEYTELKFAWLEEAVRAPDDVAAVEWSCITLSALNKDNGSEQRYVFVSPKASGKVIAKDGLSFPKGLNDINRILETPLSSSIIARHSIDQEGSKTAPATSKPGETYEYKLDTTYPLTLSLLLEGDRKATNPNGMRINIRLTAHPDSGATCSVSEALKYEQTDKLRYVLIAAIESHASAFATKNNTTKEKVIASGLRDSFPHKSTDDYSKAFNPLSIQDLTKFEATGKQFAQEADYPPLIGQLKLIDDLKKEMEQLPTKVKVNLQIVRQKEIPGEGSGLAEVEVFRAGQIQ